LEYVQVDTDTKTRRRRDQPASRKDRSRRRRLRASCCWCRSRRPAPQESAALAERLIKDTCAKQAITPGQRWNRETVQPFLTVRVAVLNDTLEQAFRSWHAGFRPLESPSAPCAA
jgi:hypothetical protein